MPDFCHLHCHTQYSLLDGASSIPALMDKAVTNGMKGIALTDHGNMFGAFKFVAEANKRGLKPIVGCEFYLVDDRHKKIFANAKGEKDRRYHQLLLAKNQLGYENLSKLCSLGFIEGLYSKYPRIDKELLLKHHEGLIATSCCLGAEIPSAIIEGNIEKAETLVKWWLDLFGEDFYIEVQRHGGLHNIDERGISQEDVNQQLLIFAEKYNIKVIATNDAHYVDEEDAAPHDILLCVNTGSKLSDENRFSFPSSDFYFKTKEEMGVRFHDLHYAMDNTLEIFDKIEAPVLKRDIILPNFPLPANFTNQAEYLRYLVFEGAKLRYKEITELIRERLDHEIKVITAMGFEGYFLVVQDFIKAARKLGVAVGPGRGSAAGSAVAYCLTITNIDPIKYNLLFERFLNPERVSMPDIDIDFDDIGRQQVIDYVIDKYGKNQVAQIITFGTMAAKSSIKDVARVLDLPLSDADRLSKYVPTRPGVKLNKMLGYTSKELAGEWGGDELDKISKLNEVYIKDDLEGRTLKMANKLEGVVRNTGIHAAGVIIAPDDIKKFIPVCTSKESDLLITQFDGSVVEEAGMLKMDFLGLKTLSIIKDCISNIVLRFGEEKRIDPDDIPLDDEDTYKLFQRGETIGIFQFESDGMQKYMKELKPTDIEDLIAMNALYRPGPMDYIPQFINRKHGREKTEYVHEWLEEMLKPTYGIMVYQEQIMEAAKIMAGFSLGKADVLRRAMGKKKASEMEKSRIEFIEGAKSKGVSEEKASEIFNVMEKFASYGFNRSHAAAYSFVAYQTAWLKAHYPAEFMASVLTHNKNNMDSIYFFLRECKRMGVEVLGPDINESKLDFTVNKNGQIRFGLSAIKGVGEGPVEDILKNKEIGGAFTGILNMVERLNLRTFNKKCVESLVLGGAFDCFEGIDRPQYFAPTGKYESYIEAVLKYGNTFRNQQESATTSLFGGMDDNFLVKPEIPVTSPWALLEKLEKEREVTGIYLSGHPLDDYKAEVENFTNCTIANLENFKGTKIKLAAIVTASTNRMDKKGNPMGNFTIQDYTGAYDIVMFREDYQKFSYLFKYGNVLYIEGAWQARWNSDERQFSIKSASLLSEVASSMTESITIKLSVHNFVEERIDQFDKIFNKKKGKHNLKFMITDELNRFQLQMLSTERKVDVDTEFLSELEKMGLEFELK